MAAHVAYFKRNKSSQIVSTIFFSTYILALQWLSLSLHSLRESYLCVLLSVFVRHEISLKHVLFATAQLSVKYSLAYLILMTHSFKQCSLNLPQNDQNEPLILSIK